MIYCISYTVYDIHDDLKSPKLNRRQDNVTNIALAAADIQSLRQAPPIARNSQQACTIKLPESRY